MQQLLKTNIPDNAIKGVLRLLQNEAIILQIKKERKTRHGDYRRLANGNHQITINANLNQYRFLITLIHEIAHFKAYKTYGRFIKPHGAEWKQSFQRLMLPFLNPTIFPKHLLPLLANHFKNPKASSDTDTKLALTLKQFDAPNDKTYIFEVPLGSIFKMYNGRVFKKGVKRIKRYECLELKSGQVYLFNPNAEVEIISSKEI